MIGGWSQSLKPLLLCRACPFKLIKVTWISTPIWLSYSVMGPTCDLWGLLPQFPHHGLVPALLCSWDVLCLADNTVLSCIYMHSS